ncbi:MAG: protein kinase [Polyangiaceae bacterium]
MGKVVDPSTETLASDLPDRGAGTGRSGVKPTGTGTVARDDDAYVFGPETRVADRYRIVRVLGRGGMGEVYEAHDETLDVRVALKTLRSERLARGVGFDELKRELSLARRVTHRGVARVFDFGTHGGGHGVAFLSMEYLPGPTLSDELRRRGTFEPEEVVAIAKALTDGLDALHAVGIVHRDMKAQNVILTRRGSGDPEPVLTDFGLATPHEADDDRPFAGTPDYMAPEQIRGEPVGPTTDLYALGVVLHELLTGTRPAGPPVPERPRDVRALRPEVPAAVADVVAKLLDVDKARRPASARATRAMLERAARAPLRKAVTLALVAVLALGSVPLAIRGVDAWRAARAAKAFAGRPHVFVAPFVSERGDEAPIAATFAELFATELRVGDAFRGVSPNTRAAIVESVTPAETPPPSDVATLFDKTHADVLTTGRVRVRGDDLDVDVHVWDARKGTQLRDFRVSGSRTDLLALVLDATSRTRRSLGRPAFSADELESLRYVIPDTSTTATAYVEALRVQRKFRFAEAIALLESVVKERPTFAPALTALAHAYRELGKDDAAREVAKRATENAKGLPRADELATFGLYAETRKAWPEAVEHYQALSTFFPDRVDHVTSFARAYVNAGRPADGVRVLEAALADVGRFPTAWDRMQIDLMITYAYSRNARDADAERAARRAMDAAKKLDAPVQLADAALALADIHLRYARFDEVLPLVDQARAVFADVGDLGGVAGCDEHAAHVHAARGDLERSLELTEHSLAIAKDLGNLYLVAHKTVAVGIAQSIAGKHTAARASFAEALGLWRAVNDREGVAHGHLNTAYEDLELGSLAGLEARILEGRSIHDAVGMARGVAESHVHMGLLRERQGRLDDGDEEYARAEALLADVSGAALAADAAFGRARVALLRADPDLDAKLARAKALALSADDPVYRAIGAGLEARRALAAGDLVVAASHAERAVTEATASHAKDAIVRAKALRLAIHARMPGGEDPRALASDAADVGARLEAIEAVDVRLDGLYAVALATRSKDVARRGLTLARDSGFRVRAWEGQLVAAELGDADEVAAMSTTTRDVRGAKAVGLLPVRVVPAAGRVRATR